MHNTREDKVNKFKWDFTCGLLPMATSGARENILARYGSLSYIPARIDLGLEKVDQ